MPNEVNITARELSAGNAQAFKSLFERYYARIHAFVFGITKDWDETEDLTQEVFIKLWNKREKFSEVQNLDAYLFAVTKNTVFSYLADNKSRQWVHDAIPESTDGQTPSDMVEMKDLQLLIDMVVDSMPPQRKLIYRLSRINGMSNDEISQKLNIQKKTVENHLNLALRMLKNVITVLSILYLC
mgnify:CR=1 FL=1